VVLEIRRTATKFLAIHNSVHSWKSLDLKIKRVIGRPLGDQLQNRVT
jgi:hypothetical protein